MLIRISDDALSRALGADELAAAFEKRGHEVQRTSSWGMQWLEPLVEIDGIGFGPATLEDVDAILNHHRHSRESGNPDGAPEELGPRFRGDDDRG